MNTFNGRTESLHDRVASAIVNRFYKVSHSGTHEDFRHRANLIVTDAFLGKDWDLHCKNAAEMVQVRVVFNGLLAVGLYFSNLSLASEIRPVRPPSLVFQIGMDVLDRVR